MDSKAKAAKFDTLLVVGVGHSGSTLFGSLMHAHSKVASVGEMARIAASIERGRQCSCGATVMNCPFWAPLVPALGSAIHADPPTLTPEHYALVRAACRKEVLLDTSKTLVIRMAKRWFSPWRRARAGYIFLVRDSRGVMASSARLGKPLAPRLVKHEKWIKRAERFAAAQGERAITVHYEDLCLDPQRELRRVCAWAGLEFEPGMLVPFAGEHHFVHANDMKYMGRVKEIRLDERWRRELDAPTIAQIEAVMARVPLLQRRYLNPVAAAARPE